MALDLESLRPGQVLVSKSGLRRIHASRLGSDTASYVLLLDTVTVHENQGHTFVVAVPDSPGLYRAPKDQFVGEEWTFVSTPVIPPPLERWFRPGTWVEDRTDKQICQIVAVLVDQVHVRARNLNVTNQRIYSREAGATVLTPLPLSLPFWACEGAKLKLKTNGMVYTLRSLDPFTRRMIVTMGEAQTPVFFSADNFDDQWELCELPEKLTSIRRTRPDWLQGGMFIRDIATRESFWIQSFHEAAGFCRIQPVKWCTEGAGDRRTPQVDRRSQEVLVERMHHFEPLDEQGYRASERRCPRCGTQGGVKEQTLSHRTYHCSDGHEWSFSYNTLDEVAKRLSRFDIEIDV